MLGVHVTILFKGHTHLICCIPACIDPLIARLYMHSPTVDAPLGCIIMHHHVLMLVGGMAAAVRDAPPICGFDELEVPNGGIAVSE